LSDMGTGDYNLSFSNSFSAATYMVSGSASGNADSIRGYTGFMAADHSNAPATGSLRVKFGLGSTGSANGQLYDSVYSMAGTHGDLA